MSCFNNLSKIAAPRRDAILDKIRRANRFQAGFEERFRYLIQFQLRPARKPISDTFTFVPSENAAVGYCIDPDTFIAQPTVWHVGKDELDKGTIVGREPTTSGFFGVIIPPELFKKYGVHAYSMVLGDLRKIQTLGVRR